MFVIIGDFNKVFSVEIIKSLIDGGVDVFEFGILFLDLIVDGLVI